MELNLISSKIYEVQGQRVMLDIDLASLYGIETKVLNQAVKRNIDRFPKDFAFIIDYQYFNENQKTTSLRRSFSLGWRNTLYNALPAL